jgi:hypothetical protein
VIDQLLQHRAMLRLRQSVSCRFELCPKNVEAELYEPLVVATDA